MKTYQIDEKTRLALLAALDDLLDYMGDDSVMARDWRGNYTTRDRREHRRKMANVRKLAETL